MAAILEPIASRAFLADFIPFQREVARWGIYASLAQTLLKLTSPGVPGFYQGTELWDFSLADPETTGAPWISAISGACSRTCVA